MRDFEADRKLCDKYFKLLDKRKANGLDLINFIQEVREGWPAALTEMEIRGKLLDCKQEQIDFLNAEHADSQRAWREENQRLRTALHDAINRPMGVVPDSAVEFYKGSE